MLREIELYSRELLTVAQVCMEESTSLKGSDFTQVEIDPITFAHIAESSIDYAIMEESNRIAVIPCDISWSDVGTWSAMSQLATVDSNGNSINGEAILRDVRNCYILSNQRIVGAIGIANLIIVDTPDALLVLNKRDAQKVGSIYVELKENGHDTYKLHKTVYKPWGSYSVLEESGNFKIKHLEVHPGASLSLQSHNHRSEHWVVVRGIAKVINGDKKMLLNSNDSTFIPPGHIHRITNPDATKLIIIEIQIVRYLGEDDIIHTVS